MFTIKEYLKERDKKSDFCETFILDLIKKIKKDNSNATISCFSEDALYKAQECDKKRINNEKSGSLDWVPFGVKDLFLVEGKKSTWASKMLENYIAPYTATVIKKLEAAWAIMLTKDNCDMFWHGNTNENSYFWAVKNALDDWRVAGGSSGGTAVNVAKGNVVFWVGSDTWWSIRQPAVYNGVVWFKPSYGKISRYWLMSYASSLDTVGFVTKNVEDIITLMNISAGKDAMDPSSIDHMPLNEKALEGTSIRWKKIWYYKNFLDYPWLDADIKAMIEKNLEKLKAEGAEVVALDFLDEKLLVSTYYTIASAETASNLCRLDWVNYWRRSPKAHNVDETYLDSRNEWFGEETKKRIVLWNQILSEGDGAEYYKKAVIVREELQNTFNDHFEKIDFLISPVVPTKAKKIWEDSRSQVDSYMSDLYTVAFSLWRLPTIALPTTEWIGFQVTGNYDKDNDLLAFAHLLEPLIQ